MPLVRVLSSLALLSGPTACAPAPAGDDAGPALRVDVVDPAGATRALANHASVGVWVGPQGAPMVVLRIEAPGAGALAHGCFVEPLPADPATYLFVAETAQRGEPLPDELVLVDDWRGVAIPATLTCIVQPDGAPDVRASFAVTLVPDDTTDEADAGDLGAETRDADVAEGTPDVEGDRDAEQDPAGPSDPDVDPDASDASDPADPDPDANAADSSDAAEDSHDAAIDATDAAHDPPIDASPRAPVTIQSWPAGAPPEPHTTADPERCRTTLTVPGDALPPPSPSTPPLRFDAALTGRLDLDAAAGAEPRVLAGGAWAAPFDFDDDGYDDLLVASRGGVGDARVRVVQVQRDGDRWVWTDAKPLAWSRDCRPVADLDGDGDDELVCVAPSDAALQIAWNDGGYSVATAPRTTALDADEYVPPDAVSAIDVDADGDRDLVLTRLGVASAVLEASSRGYVRDTRFALQSGAQTFYVGAVPTDPTDPASPLVLFEDVDGAPSAQRTYLTSGSSPAASASLIPPACDVLDRSIVDRWLGRAATDTEWTNLVVYARRMSAVDVDGHVIVGHFDAGANPADLDTPMGALLVTLGGVPCLYKTAFGGIHDTQPACYDAARGAWRLFSPWSLPSGRTTTGRLQESWGIAAVERGDIAPLLVVARGSRTPTGRDTLGVALAGMFALPTPAERGDSELGVFALGPSGAIETVDVSALPVGNFASVTTAWLPPAAGGTRRLYVLVGGFDGSLRAFEAVMAGPTTRVRVEPAPGRVDAAVFVTPTGPRPAAPSTAAWRLGTYRRAIELPVPADGRLQVRWPGAAAAEWFEVTPTDGAVVVLREGRGGT
ncbi:MAG: VCBS repeat-containing protein [Myxococcales bacterium]|nr:VCBS repeat-containing protein [Myxococcales bacterium]